MVYGDPWEILGVERQAGKDGAKRAYRALARQYHPDVDSSKKAGQRWLQISWAWEIIVNDLPIPLAATPARWDYVLASLFTTPQRIEVSVPGKVAAGTVLEVPIEQEIRSVVLTADSAPGRVLRLEIDDQEIFLFLVSSSSSGSESSSG
jgi:hypothetical protein